jgi:hypothetical protein
MRDTDPKIRQMQIEILRSRTPEQRLRSAIEQSVYLINASRRELEKRMSSIEAKIEWVRINYGEELSGKYRLALRERGDPV